MGLIEKIAREICWREFAVRPKDITKAAYWRKICDSSRAAYMRDARQFMWCYQQIPLRLINQIDGAAIKDTPATKEDGNAGADES